LLASALALLGSVLVTFLADWLLFGESTEDVNENLDKSAEKIENIEEKVKNLKKELKDFTKIRNIFQDVLAGSVEVLVKASDPELQKALQEANKRLEKTVRDLRVAEVNLANDLEGKYSKAIQKNIKDLEGQEDVLRKIIGSIKEEQEARKEALRGEGEETGILNRKRAELAAERKARDAADTRGAIANSNVRIKALQDEIKELENLGLTAEESKKKLDKLRTSLDKLAIKSANDFDQALKDIDLEEFNKQIFEVETELKSLDSKFSAISDTLTDEEAFATSRGRGLFFRTGIISRNELEGLLSEAEEFTARKIKLIDEEAEARNQALINERQAQERTILEQRQLRDADLKRRLEELDILEESGLIDPKDIQAERDKANDLIAESEAIFLAQQGALQEKFLNEQSVLYQEAEEQKTKATIEQAAIREEAVNKRFDLIRDSLLEEIDLYAEYVQKVIDLTQQKVDRQNEIEAKALAEDTRLRERAADQQFQRAIAGQDNILQFQERKLAEARIREQRAAEQAAKREEAIRLTSVYFQALEARLAEAVTNQNLTKKNKTPLSGVTSGNAALFALKDTFLAEAGAFATGVENFQGKGTETSDSNLIAFSHGESVVTAKGTKENRGLVTAMNKGMVDEYFKTMWLPKFQMDNSPSLIANFVNKDNKSDDKFIKEFREFKDMMANRPVQQVHVDSFGNIIETSYQNGLKTVIKHQTKKIL
jgi:hypothetical protein